MNNKLKRNQTKIELPVPRATFIFQLKNIFLQYGKNPIFCHSDFMELILNNYNDRRLYVGIHLYAKRLNLSMKSSF